MNRISATYSDHPPQHSDITGVILAGGRGSRMDGADKGLMEISGTTLLATIANSLEPQVGFLLISANRNLAAYQSYGYPVVTDSIAGYPGPLAGVLSAMEHCGTALLLTVPCDAPLLAPDYAARMQQSLVAADADACVAYDGAHIQPVYSLLHCKHVAALRKYLQSGKHSVQDWIKSLQPACVDFSHYPQQFYNMNTDADRKLLEAIMAERR